LPAWLFKVTRYASSNARRELIRRQRREREAAVMRQNIELQQSRQAAPSDLELVLDDALARLGRTDRQAIILRYYSGMDSADAAAVRRVESAFARMTGESGLTGINYGFTPAMPRLLEPAR
jgi:DNA-directed RNA polymerase specialized sigma24 family protein